MRSHSESARAPFRAMAKLLVMCFWDSPSWRAIFMSFELATNSAGVPVNQDVVSVARGW